MKLTQYLFVGLSFFALEAISYGAVEKFSLDGKNSKVTWAGRKIVTKDTHTGTINVKSGNIEVDVVTDAQKNKIETLKSATVVMDMESITNADLKDPKFKTKLETHLKSDDFFDVKKFGEAQFVLTKVETNPKEPMMIKVSGKLTIKEVTKDVLDIPMHFMALSDGKGYEAQGKLTIDRTEWGVKYGSGKFFKSLGDKVIDDKIDIELNLVAKK